MFCNKGKLVFIRILVLSKLDLLVKRIRILMEFLFECSRTEIFFSYDLYGRSFHL